MTRNLVTILLIAIVILLLSLNWCNRQTKTTVTKKQGNTVVTNHSTTITVDSAAIFKKFFANTKPIIKWVKSKAIHDTVHHYPYSPCDSIYSDIDSGTFNGINYAIIDTMSDNRIIGRSVALVVPKVTINRLRVDSIDRLRVDTVYVNTKQKFGTNAKWFFRGFALGGVAGFGGGSFVTK